MQKVANNEIRLSKSSTDTGKGLQPNAIAVVQTSSSQGKAASTNVRPINLRYSGEEDRVLLSEIEATKAYEATKSKKTLLFQEVVRRLNSSGACKEPRNIKSVYQRFSRLVHTAKARHMGTGTNAGMTEQDSVLLRMAAVMEASGSLVQPAENRKRGIAQIPIVEANLGSMVKKPRASKCQEKNKTACTSIIDKQRESDKGTRKVDKGKKNIGIRRAKKATKKCSKTASDSKTNNTSTAFDHAQSRKAPLCPTPTPILGSGSAALTKRLSQTRYKLENKALNLSLALTVLEFSNLNAEQPTKEISKLKIKTQEDQTVEALTRKTAKETYSKTKNKGNNAKQGRKRPNSTCGDTEAKKLKREVQKLRWELVRFGQNAANEEGVDKKVERLKTMSSRWQQPKIMDLIDSVLRWSQTTSSYLPWDIRAQLPATENECNRALNAVYRFLHESLSSGAEPPPSKDLRSLFGAIISSLKSVTRGEDQDIPNVFSVVSEQCSMTRDFLLSQFRAILAAPSTIDPSWAFPLTENILGPLLAYATESGSLTLRQHLNSIFVSIISEAASVFYECCPLKRQVRVEGCARALEVSLAISSAMDSEIVTQIPVRDVCAIGSRNVLFSMALGSIQRTTENSCTR